MPDSPDEIKKKLKNFDIENVSIEIDQIDKTFKAEILNLACICRMFECGFSPKTVGLLSKLNYKVYDAGDQNFITCDNPVAMHNPLNPYKCGVGVYGTKITLPLSSNILIKAGMNVKSGILLATPREVYEFNKRTMIMAQEFIFSKTVSDELKEMLYKYKNRFANFTFGKLPYGNGFLYFVRRMPVQ